MIKSAKKMLLLLNNDAVLASLNEFINIAKLKELCSSLNRNSKIKTIINNKNNWWNLRIAHRKILSNCLMTPIRYYWRCLYGDLFFYINADIKVFVNPHREKGITKIIRRHELK